MNKKQIEINNDVLQTIIKIIVRKERSNYIQKKLNSNRMVEQLKKIVEDEVNLYDYQNS